MADAGSVFVAVPSDTGLLHPSALTSHRLLFITNWRLQEALQRSVMSCRVSTANKSTEMCLYKVCAGVLGQACSYRSCRMRRKKETNMKAACQTHQHTAIFTCWHAVWACLCTHSWRKSSPLEAGLMMQQTRAH